MKTGNVIENVRLRLGRTISFQLLYEWEIDGLLGKVEHFKPSPKSIRNYTAQQMKLIYILSFLSSLGWTRDRLKELVVGKDKMAKNNFKSIVDNFVNYGITTLKELADDIEFII